MKQITLALILLFAAAAHAEEITVHVAGHVKNPGMHKIQSPIDPKDLEKACGGWSEFGAPARLQVVRLARPSQVEYGDPGVPKSEVFEMKEIPRMDDKLHLKANDIVYIPMKRVVAQ
jgi:uncharacterized membrane protein YecN with MAPEG domain